MFRVELDPLRKAVVIVYAGRINSEEARRCAEQVQIALAKMEPGFRLLVNLSELESMDLACSPVVADIMEMCNAAGVAEVMRIIPDPKRDIGLQILSFFHYRREVYIHTCTSREEALEILAETPQR